MENKKLIHVCTLKGCQYVELDTDDWARAAEYETVVKEIRDEQIRKMVISFVWGMATGMAIGTLLHFIVLNS